MYIREGFFVIGGHPGNAALQNRHRVPIRGEGSKECPKIFMQQALTFYSAYELI